MAMADVVAGAFLSPLFDQIFKKLASVDFTDYFRRGKLDKLVENLESTLSSINQLLDDAEIKQYQKLDVKKWLGDVKHAMYEADQLLEEIATDAPLKKLKVLGFLSAFTSPFESRIKELLENLGSLAKQKDRLGLKEETNECGVYWKPSKRFPTTSLVDESSIYGRDGDKEEAINFLLSDNVSGGGNQVPVISLGGMGKTTLAQLVYNDQTVEEQFQLRAWVHVSESFDVVGLTKAILRSFQFPMKDGEDLNLLQNQLQQLLMGKKYLLVLDDVWKRNREGWELLLLPFNHGSSGSKIVVTTRDKQVASIMKSTQLLILKQLEETNCWSLFVRHAFHGRNVSEHPNLEPIGKRIVGKCGGLPLAVKTLGNLLRRNFSQHEWEKILDTDMWRLSEIDNNVNPVLRLSYHNLPSDLKRCFAYCSIFPRGGYFYKDKLIKLWMAEGLLKCRTDKSEEELGNEFFNDLESISFFQVQPPAWRWDDHEGFVMHDLVSDLAKSVSGEFCLEIKGDRLQGIPERTRHIQWSLELDDGDKILEHVYKIKGLRSLMVLQDLVNWFVLSDNVQRDMFSRLKYLRMLSFRRCYLSNLADEIKDLKLLRYLDLSLTEITSLPDSICLLYNLQTLILNRCQLTELPSDFYKLVNLRHLELEGICILKKMPKDIGSLIHLQTLTMFVVGERSGSDIKELAKLNQLQGSFRIVGLENVIDAADATEANLKDKKHLEKLNMMYSAGGENNGGLITQRDVLEALQPNSNLNTLTIENYRGTSFPNWLGGCPCLPNLVYLTLGGCEFCSQLPSLGQLPSLKWLRISSCHGIEIIGAEFYGNNSSNVPFRSLEYLEFKGMPNWKEWICFEGLPSLKNLVITDCPKLKGVLPQHLPSLQELKIRVCQELEASIPKSANLRRLSLVGCKNIMVNESPSNLTWARLRGTRVIGSCLEQILFSNAYLEELRVEDFNGANLEFSSSLDLRRCNSFHTLEISTWDSSSLPFALDSFTNLHSLTLFDCPQLESFPGGGLPSSLSSLNIYSCPELFASREEWGLFQLHSLKKLTLSDLFGNVESFPEENLLPPTLESLRVVDFPLRILS